MSMVTHMAVVAAVFCAAATSQEMVRIPAGAFEVLVEVDSGQHRSGVPPSQASLVAAAAARSGLVVRGVFTFPGHGYAPGAATRVAAEEGAALAEAATLLAEHGFDSSVRSGGSTPTASRTTTSCTTAPGTPPWS